MVTLGMCYLPICKCLMHLRPDILCAVGAPPIAQPPFKSPSPNLKTQILEFTYCNVRFPMETTSHKLNKYAILQLILSQQGWTCISPIIITTRN